MADGEGGRQVRARLVLGDAEWRTLDGRSRHAAGRAFPVGTVWTKLRDEAGNCIAHRSSPLALAAALEARRVLRDTYSVAATVTPVHTHAALAAVVIRGVRVVMGAGSPMHSAADAEVRGVPVAIVRDGVVTPYDAAVYGHADAELLAAPLLDRAQTAAAGAR